MKNSKYHLIFLWVISSAHFMAYFIAGILAANIFDYENLFLNEELSLLMRPVSSPIVFLGPVLQLIRGLLLGLILLPIYKVIVEEKYGIYKLGVLILGLCLISTIGPTSGSFDGFIYTTIPVTNQIVGYFEAIIYAVLFCLFIRIPFKYNKKWIHFLYLIFIVCVSALLISAYFNAVG
ncbi:MAG: hypothetical protein LUD76_06415, partial [Alistipes sp.]|nr:hypothetical protein [Alistipes sp.]